MRDALAARDFLVRRMRNLRIVARGRCMMMLPSAAVRTPSTQWVRGTYASTNERPPATFSRPEVPGCASRGEPLRKPSSDGRHELLLELVGRSEFESAIRGCDDRLGFTVCQPCVWRPFTCPMDPHERFEQVAICERFGVWPQGANCDGLLERTSDRGLVLLALADMPEPSTPCSGLLSCPLRKSRSRCMS